MDILLDAVIDTFKLLPFLFVTYVIIEWIEHSASNSITESIQKSSKFGPLIGSAAGLIPQCGFSSIASTLYVTRVLTLGTLISIYLATSDEMLPILISNNAPIDLIVKILAIKFIVGVIVGYCIDLVIRKRKQDHIDIDAFCEGEDCHCEEEGIFVSALKHTIKIGLYIFGVTILLNLLLEYVHLETLLNVSPTLTTFVSAIVGLIPNCAASIVLTELYLGGALDFGALMAGLLTNAGVGLLVLFRINHNQRENFKIIGILVVVGVAVGLSLQLLGI
ncbi:putative manganese transporter [Anaerorhabdus sp.]|uniref:putative manganese transporter n=1 Tax=Anaerorhabdus sp. TaxID=1872524 RepID=UPI002FCAFA0B